MRKTSQLVWELLRRGTDPGQIQTWLGLHGALRDCESALDVGCGAASNLGLLHLQHLTGIDGYSPSVDQARRNATHHEVILGDVGALDQLFRPGQFDACVALDVIEHLPKENGHKLLRDMERIARKTVVILTPNGFLPQAHAEHDDLQVHLSGWEPREMRALGYQVTGLLGPKRFRGEYHALRYKPKLLWAGLSMLGQWTWTRRHPEAAAAILAVKSMDRHTANQPEDRLKIQ